MIYCAKARRRAAGFTLLEVGVAAAILGGVIGGLLIARSRMQKQATAADRMLAATRIASGRVAALRAGILGEGEGDTDQPAGYHWRIARSAPDSTMTKGIQCWQVDVTPPGGDADNAVTLIVWLYSPEAAAGGTP